MRSAWGPPSSSGKGFSATLGIIIALAVGFVLSWLPSIGDTLRTWLAFSLPTPWGALTYPFIHSGDGTGLFWFLLSLLWVWWVGNDAERSYGKVGMLLHFFGFAALMSLGWLAGAFIVGRPDLPLIGAFPAVAAMTVLFAARNPEQPVAFFFIAQFAAKWLALVTALLVVFNYGTGAPLLGVMLALPLGLVWLYGQNRLPIRPGPMPMPSSRKPSKQQIEREAQFRTKVMDREKEREERERLRKLFENSLKDDRKD